MNEDTRPPLTRTEINLIDEAFTLLVQYHPGSQEAITNLRDKVFDQFNHVSAS